MRLRYADDARLYVPMERMDLVQSYNSLGEAAPQLDRLGGTGWTARKSKVKKALTDLADKLLELYAERKALPGFAYSADTPWQREFEDAFGFAETPDQATAITDIKRDMEKPQPMDRLLCGDVGYGKTEVAMRAAFKALADSKQVALLAPTTVLVFQHCQTFRRSGWRRSPSAWRCSAASVRARAEEDHRRGRGGEGGRRHRDASSAFARCALSRSGSADRG